MDVLNNVRGKVFLLSRFFFSPDAFGLWVSGLMFSGCGMSAGLFEGCLR